jgi:hypothetical protein
MKEKITMFITYIEFFHKMHTKYLKRFSNKIQLIYTHISNDIKFDDTIEVSKNKKKELIDELIQNDIDKELLKDIKISIGSETNSENSENSEDSKSKLNSLLSHNYEKFQTNIITPDIKYDNTKSSLSNINTLLDNTQAKKKHLKSIFKKNVYKVSNILQLCKPKSQQIQNSQILSDDVDKIFYGINKSCDNIIETNENKGLTVENLDSKYNKETYEEYNFSSDILKSDDSIFKQISIYNDNYIVDSNSVEEVKIYNNEKTKIYNNEGTK